MRKKGNKDLIKIGELAKAAEVAVSTIHYYVREGLLTPPTKTSRNMAYYDPQSIQEIRLIQELQAKRFLPLSVIKLIMQAKREGQNMDHIVEMRSLMEDIFRPVENETKLKGVSLAGLVVASELPESTLKTLEAMGLIVPVETEHGLIYDDIDVRIAQIFKKLAGYALKPDSLDIYRQYIEVIRAEAKSMHDTVHQLPDHEKVPLLELFNATKDLKEYLAMKVYRQEIQYFHEYSFRQRENK
jgi:DNA-binding transcriptional MerR regulator